MACVFLSLGSNTGDRLAMLSEAVSHLADHYQIDVEAVSKVYETAPVGLVEQDSFLNIALRIKTSLAPFDLLQATQDIEQKMDRKKTVRWGPRNIDIDIISYENVHLETDTLTLPHKEALKRAFVLVPLAEVASVDFKISGKKIKDALKNAPHDNDIIWLYQETLPF